MKNGQTIKKKTKNKELKENRGDQKGEKEINNNLNYNCYNLNNYNVYNN